MTTGRRRCAALVVAGVAATAVALGTTTALAALAGPLGLALDVGSATASALSAVALATALLAGTVTGPLGQRAGARPLLLCAAVLLPGGLCVLAGAPAFPAAMLGVLVLGSGAGCVLVPVLTAVALTDRLTDRHRARDLAIVSAGGALGTAVLPPAALVVAMHAGLTACLLGLAAVAATVLTACAAATASATPDVAWAAAPVGRRAGFAALTRLYVASIALSAAVFVPLVHLPAYAEAAGLGSPFGAAMLSVMGVASLVGRLPAAAAARRVGTETALRTGALGLAVGAGIWLAGPDPAVVVVAAAVLGFAHGGYVALYPAAVAERHGPVGLGGRLGVLYTASAAGALAGPIGAGAVTAFTGAPAAGTAAAALAGWWLLRTTGGPPPSPACSTARPGTARG